MSIRAISGMTAALRAKIARFSRDKRGVSAVEFAIILPFMAALYLGGTALTQGIIVKRKVVLVTHTVGDLVARDNNLTDAEIAAVFDAAKAVFAPYAWNSNLLKIKVSSINIDAAGNAKVGWSDAFQDTARPKNSTVTLPPGLNTANSSIIWAEVSYNFTPPIGTAFTGGTLPMTDQLYIRPRLVTTVTRSAN
ncbi:MAG: pilus assembly protein [Xanthobacteraceae bacterium]|nr:pilus assembly protein [Xanthobacteraceae bacterium]MCW5673549.1 pilus assembly protein [Xanthobacteraceae bacterium]